MSSIRTSIIRALNLKDPTPDAILVRTIAAGDSDALPSLINRHGPMELRVCQQSCRATIAATKTPYPPRRSQDSL